MKQIITNTFLWIHQHPYITLLLGFVTHLLICRRRFYRRGIGGLQHYSSFAAAVLITIMEWIISILALLSMFMAFMALQKG